METMMNKTYFFLVIILSVTPLKTTDAIVKLEPPLPNKNNNLHQFVLSEFDKNDHSQKSIHHFIQILSNLNYKMLKVVSLKQRSLDKIRTYPFPTFMPIAPYMPQQIPIKNINFMQNSIHDVFHQRQYDIISTARKLQRNKNIISTLPKIHIWRDTQHNIWTINHRRLASMILAGNIKMVHVIWEDKAQVDANKFEYTTKVSGKSINAFLSQRIIVEITYQYPFHQQYPYMDPI